MERAILILDPIISVELKIGEYVMKRQINEQEKLSSLMGEHEMQMFNAAMTGYYSFVEWPEAWELNDFDDMTNDMEIN
jgi:hypothetical protein